MEGKLLEVKSNTPNFIYQLGCFQDPKLTEGTTTTKKTQKTKLCASKL